MKPTHSAKSDSFGAAILVALAALLIFVWYEVLFAGPPREPSVVFFDVGQGDATMLILKDGIKILTDAGPSGRIKEELAGIAGGGRYIDLALISHAQLDHFNGFNYLLDYYDFGAFVWNGRGGESEEWRLLVKKILAKNIPLITVRAGDSIRYKNNIIDVISPNGALVQSAEPNDTSIVALARLDFPGVNSSGQAPARPLRVLLTGDIGFSAENYLALSARAGSIDIKTDILKVPHHGSKNSSGGEFLREASPKIAVIEVGSGNRYGHPSAEALSRLEAVGAAIFRTDKDGAIELTAADGKIKIFH